MSGTPGFLVSGRQSTPIENTFPSLAGVPADQATIDAVSATMRDSVACINAGDARRIASLYTENYFRYLFGGVDDQLIQDLSTASPNPPGPANQAVVVAPVNVRVLDDGRVTAVTGVNDERGLFIFAIEGGRYLIDGNTPLTGAGTPTP